MPKAPGRSSFTPYKPGGKHSIGVCPCANHPYTKVLKRVNGWFRTHRDNRPYIDKHRKEMHLILRNCVKKYGKPKCDCLYFGSRYHCICSFQETSNRVQSRFSQGLAARANAPGPDQRQGCRDVWNYDCSRELVVAITKKTVNKPEPLIKFDILRDDILANIFVWKNQRIAVITCHQVCSNAYEKMKFINALGATISKLLHGGQDLRGKSHNPVNALVLTVDLNIHNIYYGCNQAKKTN
uniref:Uncharacterized protein n=1 Tax=Tetranychus urticae TaxID=32264 RepID=T1JVP2_TETUR